MAFLRWRGSSPSLVATVYEHGRSRQVHLATFDGMRYVTGGLRAQVEARFPHVAVDWGAVDLALAKGPPGVQPVPPWDRGDWAEIERRLRFWAAMEPTGPADAPRLLAAAHVLRIWRMGAPDFRRLSPPAGWDAAGRGVVP